MHNTTSANYLDSVPPISQISVLPDGSVDLNGLLDPLLGTPIPEFNPVVSFTSSGGMAQQFPGNIIPANQVSKAGLNTLLDFFPKPNFAGTNFGWFKNFLVDAPDDQNYKLVDGLDHNLSNNDRLAAVYQYNYGNLYDAGPYDDQSVVPNAGDNDFGNNQENGSQEYSITETHLFSTRFLNEARFGYTRYYLNQYPLLQGQICQPVRNGQHRRDRFSRDL